MTSNAIEDYLKAIYNLQEKYGRAKTSALAQTLGVTAGSVTDMIKRLSHTSPHLITYKHHQGVKLTPLGRKSALDIIRRHRLLETFLHDTLGLSWDEVHAEAEVLEHHISERVADALEVLLDHPDVDPHGEPIPGKNGELPIISQRRLSDIKVGATVRIVRVDPEQDELLRYLDDIGITIGTVATVIDKAPLEGPLRLRIQNSRNVSECSLGTSAADSLYVDALPVPSP